MISFHQSFLEPEGHRFFLAAFVSNDPLAQSRQSIYNHLHEVATYLEPVEEYVGLKTIRRNRFDHRSQCRDRLGERAVVGMSGSDGVHTVAGLRIIDVQMRTMASD